MASQSLAPSRINSVIVGGHQESRPVPHPAKRAGIAFFDSDTSGRSLRMILIMPLGSARVSLPTIVSVL
jgi:polysaccharide deacetylase 2 family uncharacterized protein YibQ